MNKIFFLLAMAQQREPSLMKITLIWYHEQEENKNHPHSPRRSPSAMKGLPFLRERGENVEGDGAPVPARQEVHHKEEEERGEDEEEPELVDQVLYHRLVAQVPWEAHEEEEGGEEEA